MEKKARNIKKNVSYKIIICLALTLGIYFSFGLYHLEKFETADERYWMYEDPENGRIWTYWESILNGNWKATHINDKPGVSLAYVSGPALLFKNDPDANLFSFYPTERIYNPAEIMRIHWLFRLPLLIFSGLFSLVLFWLIWKWTENEWIALWSSVFILLSPILLGISQIVNPDSLLWSFSAATLFSFFNFLKSKEKKYFFLASFFLGWAILTKYSAIVLVPFFLASAILSLFIKNNQNGNIDYREIRLVLVSYVGIIVGALAVFSFFMPAILVYPQYLYREFFALSGFNYILSIILTVIAFLLIDAFVFHSRIIIWIFNKCRLRSNVLLQILAFILLAISLLVLFIWIIDARYGEDITRGVSFDAEKGRAFHKQNLPVQIILEFVPLIFSLVPLTLFAWMFLLGKSIIKTVSYSKEIILVLFFLITFYAAVLYQGLLVTIRYAIMVYPFVLFLASLGMWEIFNLQKLKNINKMWITVDIILVSVFSLWMTKPFYFNYTSFLLPQDKIIADAWGYGGYEAAQYLNNLPDIQNLTVWTDYNGFCPFIKAKCIMGKNNGKLKLTDGAKIPDYFVKTRRGSILYKGVWDTIKEKIINNNSDPVWQLVINGRSQNYVNIYKYVPENL